MVWIEAGYASVTDIDVINEIRKLWRCSVCGHQVHSLRRPGYSCPMCRDKNMYEYELAPASMRFIRKKKK